METVLLGDALERLRELPADSVNCCVTSPPYYCLRDYGTAGQIGMEDSPEEYIDRLVEVFREVRRVLRPDGTLWVVIGDSYAGSWHGRNADGTPGAGGNEHISKGSRRGTVPKRKDTCKAKDMIGIPWMLAFALRADGWYLRQDIIWQKSNCMPESVRDRCTKSHEYIFLLSKRKQYYFDAEAISEPIAGSSTKRYLEDIEQQAGSYRQPGRGNRPMKAALPRFGGNKYPDHNDGDSRKCGNVYIPTLRRNKRDVWTIATGGYKGTHFAVFPEKLASLCILAGSPEGGLVLDPFAGSGTTGAAAKRLKRGFIGIEINPDYQQMALERIAAAAQEE